MLISWHLLILSQRKNTWEISIGWEIDNNRIYANIELRWNPLKFDHQGRDCTTKVEGNHRCITKCIDIWLKRGINYRFMAYLFSSSDTRKSKAIPFWQKTKVQ